MRSITTVLEAEIALALETSDFHLGNAAVALGVTRAALKDRVDRTPALVAMMEDASEVMVDDAEAVIRKDLKTGDGPTAKFVAQTKGKNRGWATAGVNDKGAIIVEVRTFPDPAPDGGADGSKG